ncbi:hypothetical protein INR49_013790 [Caranx melampygus]|nr:hypothetical protein INR49_013790 [Caranx melampygus]
MESLSTDCNPRRGAHGCDLSHCTTELFITAFLITGRGDWAVSWPPIGSSSPLTPRLLAGAPKEKAPSLQNVNETGAVYSCPLTTDTSDCSRMDLVGTTNPSTEKVEGMWLGVTVASQRDQQGGRVLACGHRYVKVIQGGTGEQWRMIGKCFVRSNDLTYNPDDDWQTDSYEACNPNFDMDFEGMCNMGISAGMTDTDVYMGAPGSYLWQGYSVLEEKRLLSHDDFTVVTGSPRDGSKGSVMFGTKTDSTITEALIIPGNNWNDLIVGAPFYFDRMNDEGGAVYVFMNENGSFQKTATIALRGPSGSAFGFAVAAIGDINQDGFQDFAVGAPFHDTGRVYIWMGSKQGISESPSQVIEGKSVNNGFNTFGYSINGGMDMDDNSYPDILIGSLDDRIALLRARPVVHITKDFNVEPKIVDPNLCPESAPCQELFSVQSAAPLSLVTSSVGVQQVVWSQRWHGLCSFHQSFGFRFPTMAWSLSEMT